MFKFIFQFGPLLKYIHDDVKMGQKVAWAFKIFFLTRGIMELKSHGNSVDIEL
jgi:hypothetical protein